MHDADSCAVGFKGYNIRVLIDFEKLSDLNCGLGQYSYHLGTKLAELADREFHPVFLTRPGQTGLLGKGDYLHLNKLYRYLGFPKVKVDIWHATQQDMKWVPRDQKTIFLLSILDLNFLHELTDKIEIQNRLSKLQNLVNRCDAIVTISQYSKKMIEKNLNIQGKKVHVIYISHALDLKQEQCRPNFILDKKFFFSIGVVEPKKNFHVLVALMEKIVDRDLIIAGYNESEYAQEITELAKNHGIENRVKLVGKIPESQKLWLYQNCEAFFFPSLLEGFGMPVVEAMAYGRPVFISNETSLPEVAGPEAYIWDDFDAEKMYEVFVKAMAEFDQDPSKKSRMKKWLERYDWSKTAKQHIALYRELLSL